LFPLLLPWFADDNYTYNGHRSSRSEYPADELLVAPGQII
jgi:hypothetical protein